MFVNNNFELKSNMSVECDSMKYFGEPIESYSDQKINEVIVDCLIPIASKNDNFDISDIIYHFKRSCFSWDSINDLMDFFANWLDTTDIVDYNYEGGFYFTPQFYDYLEVNLPGASLVLREMAIQSYPNGACEIWYDPNMEFETFDKIGYLNWESIEKIIDNGVLNNCLIGDNNTNILYVVKNCEVIEVPKNQ